MPVHKIHYPQTEKWFVAYTESIDVFHFGRVGVHNVMDSGQEEMEMFGSETALAARTNKIKGIPKWYEDNINTDPKK